MHMKSKIAIRSQSLLASAIGALGAMLFTGALASTLASPAPSPMLLTLEATLAIAMLTLAIRAFRMGVIVGPSTVTIRNLIRTHRVSSHSARGFAFGNSESFVRRSAFLKLADGNRIQITAIQPAPGDPQREHALELVQELNDALGDLNGRVPR